MPPRAKTQMEYTSKRPRPPNRVVPTIVMSADGIDQVKKGERTGVDESVPDETEVSPRLEKDQLEIVVRSLEKVN